MEHIGVAIRKIRKELGLKVYELASGVSVSPVYITQIEKHGKLPSPRIMKRISSILRDKRLFNLYLKMKYPMVSGMANMRVMDSGFSRIAEGFLNELRKIRESLERIETRIK